MASRVTLFPRAGEAGKHGFREPEFKILGTDLAGQLEAEGRKVTRFHPGQDVLGMSGSGAFAGYARVPEKAALAPKPVSMTFEQAAALTKAALIALQGIRDKAQVLPGQRVLITEAGGGAGSLAVQIAESYGVEVTGVNGPSKLEMLRSIGADQVIDYTDEDFDQNGPRYDVILDLAACRTVVQSRRSLTPSGICLMAGGFGTATWQSALLGPIISRFGNVKIEFLLAEDRSADLLQMIELFEAGTVVPVTDRCCPLSETGEALRRAGDKQSLEKSSSHRRRLLVGWTGDGERGRSDSILKNHKLVRK